MAASDNLGSQFIRHTLESDSQGHQVNAFEGDKHVGWMAWSPTGELEDINVAASHRRRGIATGMWNYGHQQAKELGIVAPTHGTYRTTTGDAWARSIGGKIPKNKMPK